MASDFRQLANRSMLDLLKDSGYLQVHDAVRESKLRAVFEASPDLIQTWLSLSEDQRTGEGHYLLSPNISGRGWVVGYLPGTKEERFSDGPRACARFVKLEVEALRRMIEESSPPKRERPEKSRQL